MSGLLWNIPPLPLYYLPRQEELARVKAALLEAMPGPVVITGVGRDDGGPGMEGLGKSVLAAAVARDPEVGQAFPDGIYWIRIGRHPDLLSIHCMLIRVLGGKLAELPDLQHTKTVLRDLLRERACLLILDDVWEIEHLEAFSVVGPRGCLLFTTQDNGQLAMLAIAEHQVMPLSQAEALTLLAYVSGNSVDALPPTAVDIARLCDYLPLPIALMGGLLREQPELWDALPERLRDVDIEKLSRHFPDRPYPELIKALQVSMDHLPQELRVRYLDLAVFPEGVPIPESVLQVIWTYEGLTPAEIEQIIARLARLALVQRDETEHLVYLHELQCDYLQKHTSNRPELHTRLLDAYRAILPKLTAAPSTGPVPWHLLPRDEDYMWSHLAHHLVEAHRQDELWRLLLDFAWLQARMETGDAIMLYQTYELLPYDEDLQQVQEALRLSIPALIADHTQLAGQLWGRLAAGESPHIRSLLRQARRYQGAPWLRPLTASLRPPGGPLIKTIAGHREAVKSVAVTADGQRALAASGGRLHLWNLEQSTLLRSIHAHRSAINRVVLLPDGRHALSASEDATVKLWDLEQGKGLDSLTGHRYGVNGIALMPDGHHAVTASSEGSLIVWEIALPTGTGSAERVIKVPGGPVWDVVALPDGIHVVSASADGALRIWDAKGATLRSTLRGHGSEVYCVASTSDGSYILSGSADCTVKVWDLERETLLYTLRGHSAPVRHVTISPDGEWVLSASDDGTIRVWDLARGMEYTTLTGHRGTVYAIAVTPSGLAVSASADRTLCLWDLERGAGLHTLSGHRDAVNGLALLPDGERVLSASRDGSLKLWSMRWLRSPQLVLRGHKRDILGVTVTGDGRWAISASRDHTLKVWDLEQKTLLRTLTGHNGPVNAVAVLPSGRHIISASSDRTLRAWDLEQGHILHILHGHSEAVTDVVVCRAGLVAVSASRDGTLKVWDLTRNTELCTLAGDTGPLLAVAATDDGSLIIAASDSGPLIWRREDEGTWSGPQRLGSHPGPVSTVGITPDGRYAVSGSDDRVVILWELRTGRIVARFTGESPISSCAIMPNGATIVAGERSGRIHFLQLEGRADITRG